MSLALPTLTLLYLLAPGLLFRRLYYTGEFSEQYFKATFSDLLFSTIFPSVFIHLISYCIVMKWYVLNTSVFSVLISGTDMTKEIETALANIYQFKVQIISYLLMASLLGALLGFFSKYFIRKLKLDRKHRMFRFSNRWHYLFTGEILDYPGFPGDPEDINLRYIDALVDTQDGSILYSGTLEEYILNKSGGIDSIYLSDVKRRYLKHDDRQANHQPYYHLPGQFFVIPFEEIKNLHITYYSVTVSQTQLQSDVDNIEVPD